MEKFQIFSNPGKLYAKMLQDISQAKKSIYLETYIYDNDKIGNLFKKILEKKAKQGIEVFVLIDAYGSSSFKSKLITFFKIKENLGMSRGVNREYFSKLESFQGKVQFFREIRYVLRMFGQNHERNHRKLLIIDNKISYIGSANITASCLNWRELVLRLESPIAHCFAKSFFEHWNMSGRLSIKKIRFMAHKGFEILHDSPGDKKMTYGSRYLDLINQAQHEISIETPYFVPPRRIRKALAKAVKRKVKVSLLLPLKSDATLLDIVRDRYLGSLSKKGIKIFYYKPGILHSKLLLIDDKFFLLGSSNLDYRSFLHQHEINILGRDKQIIKKLKAFFSLGLSKSKLFDYQQWRTRSHLKKLLETLSSLINHYL